MIAMLFVMPEVMMRIQVIEGRTSRQVMVAMEATRAQQTAAEASAGTLQPARQVSRPSTGDPLRVWRTTHTPILVTGAAP